MIKTFFYCTKFAVGKGQPFKSYWKAKFSRNMQYSLDTYSKEEFKDRKNIIITIAVYEHKEWQKLLALKNPSCKDKEDLAFRKDKARVPVDGSQNEGYVTLTERNWFRPVMYYVAVMDCDDEIHNILGHNKYGRIEIEATLQADDDHFSYER